MSQTKPPELLLTAAELANQLRISKTLLYELKAQGKLPVPIRLGRRILWPRSEIEQWIHAGCPPSHKWHIIRKNNCDFPSN